MYKYHTILSLHNLSKLSKTICLKLKGWTHTYKCHIVTIQRALIQQSESDQSCSYDLPKTKCLWAIIVFTNVWSPRLITNYQLHLDWFERATLYVCWYLCWRCLCDVTLIGCSSATTKPVSVTKHFRKPVWPLHKVTSIINISESTTPSRLLSNLSSCSTLHFMLPLFIYW